MSKVVLGLDGGGTQTRALAADFDRENRRRPGQAGPCSLSALSCRRRLWPPR